MTFDDLKVGMLLKNWGFVVRLIQPGEDPFWEDKHALVFIEHDDAYWGQCTTSPPNETTFDLLYEEGTPEYQQVIKHIIEQFVQRKANIQNDIDLLRAYLRIGKKEN